MSKEHDYAYHGNGDGSQVVCGACDGQGTKAQDVASNIFSDDPHLIHTLHRREMCTSCQGSGWLRQ